LAGEVSFVTGKGVSGLEFNLGTKIKRVKTDLEK
jgi:hypothetical protein